MKSLLRLLLLALSLVFANAFADGTDPFKPEITSDKDYTTGKAAIEAKNWKAAIASFDRASSKFRDNADIQNWLGYSYRKSGDLDRAFKHYNAALKLDANHRGAHEYIGEAYLMKNDVASAEKHLGQLARLCNKSCEEYKDLEHEIAEHKGKTAAK